MTKPTRRHPVRFVQSWLLISCVAIAGCQMLSGPSTKQRTHEKWSEVRGGLKFEVAAKQYKNRLFEEAIVSAGEAIALDPKRADAYVIRARSHLELGRPASAWAELQQAQARGLHSAELLYTEGVIREQRGQIELALGAHAAARSMDPRATAYVVAEAECLVELDRLEEAFALLEEHIDEYDDDGSIALMAGKIAAQLGDDEAAVQRYEHAMIAAPNNRLVVEALGLGLVRVRRYEEAIERLRSLLGRDAPEPASGAVLRALATSYIATGAPKRAVHILTDHAAQHPEDAAAQLILARGSLLNGDTSAALHAVDRADDVRPDDPEIWLVHVAALWQRGELDKAASMLYDFLAARPSDADAHCLLGEILRSKEAATAAGKSFRRALELDPNNAWARAAIARLDQEPAADRDSSRSTPTCLTANDHKQSEGQTPSHGIPAK